MSLDYLVQYKLEVTKPRKNYSYKFLICFTTDMRVEDGERKGIGIKVFPLKNPINESVASRKKRRGITQQTKLF